MLSAYLWSLLGSFCLPLAIFSYAAFSPADLHLTTVRIIICKRPLSALQRLLQLGHWASGPAQVQISVPWYTSPYLEGRAIYCGKDETVVSPRRMAELPEECNLSAIQEIFAQSRDADAQTLALPSTEQLTVVSLGAEGEAHLRSHQESASARVLWTCVLNTDSARWRTIRLGLSFVALFSAVFLAPILVALFMWHPSSDPFAVLARKFGIGLLFLCCVSLVLIPVLFGSTGRNRAPVSLALTTHSFFLFAKLASGILPIALPFADADSWHGLIHGVVGDAGQVRVCKIAKRSNCSYSTDNLSRSCYLCFPSVHACLRLWQAASFPVRAPPRRSGCGIHTALRRGGGCELHYCALRAGGI